MSVAMMVEEVGWKLVQAVYKLEEQLAMVAVETLMMSVAGD